MRVSEYGGGSLAAQFQREATRPPASFVAAKIIGCAIEQNSSFVYIGMSEGFAWKVAEAARCFAPHLETILLPPWDCLPYDRVLPSRQCMGRRMDALRVWSTASSNPRLLITSLEAILQRIPPLDVISSSWFEVTVGKGFDRLGFELFVSNAGYIQDGLVDEPGEWAFRGEDVIDIFPAGQIFPTRIIIAEDGLVGELKSYDPMTQRTNSSMETMVLGPASEAVARDKTGEENASPPSPTERGLIELYGEMPVVFDLFGDAKVLFATGADDRASTYLDFIDEARQAHRDHVGVWRSFYLDHAQWTDLRKTHPSFHLDVDDGTAVPKFVHEANPRKAFAEFVDVERGLGRKILLAGQGRLFDGLCRRVERDLQIRSIEDWFGVERSDAGSILRMSCALEHGFVARDLNVVAITTADVLGDGAEQSGTTRFLAEPDLRVGDVVVHEEHGIGILRGLENVEIDGAFHDAARLEYHGAASVLVPMQEFGKMWRYSSEPQAVTLDCLHTETWAKKREAAARDVRRAARHLSRLTRERSTATAQSFAPPRAEFSKFLTRFPYSLTPDQRSAIRAVLDDLGSGKPMNRLICGDVGFGKTEIALRATAAVALSGGQVAVVVPTTVLARQHFLSFERRFAGTGINVAMLSRVVDASETKRIKAGLGSGDIHVVVATHAVLAKDVAFARLGLLVIDEEHRFGTKDKSAMKNLAPVLHTLTMSATPIPRTLQTAMVGLQDVSLLTTPPSKRRPVRTALSEFDPPSMRVALLRERRRGGQSFVIAPQIEDLERLKQILDDLVPELSIQVAHGKLQSAAMDQVMVDFADGHGDVLLSTNIIESGLDVPRANTMFIWRADRFGLAQLHQLRGRVGRGQRQGIAYLLTVEGDEMSEETRLRLSAMVENDRLGAGLAISIQDLDLRGGGDITGEDQAGHMKVLGVGLYQRLLERAVTRAKNLPSSEPAGIAVNIGLAGRIPEDYVPDASVRLNLYARLFRGTSTSELDALEEEFEDRFGDVPEDVMTLMRLQKLKVEASRFYITKIDAGPRAMALSFASKPTRQAIKLLSKTHQTSLRDGRLIYESASPSGIMRLQFFEKVFKAAGTELAHPN